MTTAWYNTTLGKELLDVAFDLGITGLLANHLHHLVKEGEHLLAGQAMERSCQATVACADSKIGIGKCRSDEVHRVRGHIAALMVGVYREEKAK